MGTTVKELVVQGHHLAPVGVAGVGGVGVDRVDCGHQLILAGPSAGRRHALEALPHEGVSLGDQRPVPAAAVLLVQGDQLATGDPGRAAGIDEQQEGEQARDLALVGEQLAQHAGETDRLVRQLDAHRVVARAGEVALVEDEVDDGEHGVQPLGQVGRLRHAVRDVRALDLRLRAGDALRHRGLGHEEGPRDLGDGESAEHAQREGHTGLG